MSLNKPSADTFPLMCDSKQNVVQLSKLNHRHLSIMDFMLANPQLKMGEIAQHFGVTPAWLSTVRNSDLFRARFNERRGLMEEDQRNRITQKLADLAEKGLGTMEAVLEDEEVDARLKVDTAKTALEAIGFLGKGVAAAGAQQGGAQPVQVVVQAGVFEEARNLAMQGSTARIAQPVTIEQEDI